jgi:DNA-binding NtrC family response regulator
VAHHFLKKYARENGRAVTKTSDEAMEALMDYPFPGNVRELESAIQVAAVLADGDHISAEDLPDSMVGAAGAKRRESLDDGKSVELMATLRSVTITDREGPVKRWHATLRSVAIEAILQFLLKTGGGEFSRREFASFLSLHGKNSRNRYGTAGRYLRILRHHGILAQNGKKANETRFRLHSP